MLGAEGPGDVRGAQVPRDLRRGMEPWQAGGLWRAMPSNAIPFHARSVEHDFRQQEGRFQRVLSHIEGDTTPSSPVAVAGAVLTPRQEPSPVTKLPAKLDAKKSRRKCFWFL